MLRVSGRQYLQMAAVRVSKNRLWTQLDVEIDECLCRCLLLFLLPVNIQEGPHSPDCDSLPIEISFKTFYFPLVAISYIFIFSAV